MACLKFRSGIQCKWRIKLSPVLNLKWTFLTLVEVLLRGAFKNHRSTSFIVLTFSLGTLSVWMTKCFAVFLNSDICSLVNSHSVKCIILPEGQNYQAQILLRRYLPGLGNFYSIYSITNKPKQHCCNSHVRYVRNAMEREFSVLFKFLVCWGRPEANVACNHLHIHKSISETQKLSAQLRKLCLDYFVLEALGTYDWYTWYTPLCP